MELRLGGSTKRWCVAFLLVIGDKLKQNNSSVKEKISQRQKKNQIKKRTVKSGDSEITQREI